MNNVYIEGRLGKDPELRFTQAGKAVLNFSLADTPRRRNDRGEWEDAGETLWLSCSLFGPKAEAAAEVLRKGSLVLAHGTLRQRSFKTRDGEDRTVIEANLTSIAPLPSIKGDGQQGPGWQKPQSDPWGGASGDKPF